MTGVCWRRLAFVTKISFDFWIRFKLKDVLQKQDVRFGRDGDQCLAGRGLALAMSRICASSRARDMNTVGRDDATAAPLIRSCNRAALAVLCLGIKEASARLTSQGGKIFKHYRLTSISCGMCFNLLL